MVVVGHSWARNRRGAVCLVPDVLGEREPGVRSLDSRRRRRSPCLWEFQGHLYTHRWLEPNVTFLNGALNVRSVRDVLIRAGELLADKPEHHVAARMRWGFQF